MMAHDAKLLPSTDGIALASLKLHEEPVSGTRTVPSLPR